jgi:hypothetical protein
VLALGTVEEIKKSQNPTIHRFLHVDFKPNHQT